MTDRRRRRVVDARPARRDDGVALVLVLVLTMFVAMLTLPLLDVGIATAKQGGVAREKARRTEAVRGATRLALADTQALYEACGSASAGTGTQVATEGLPAAVTTTCYRLSSTRQFASDSIPYSIGTLVTGSTTPSGTWLTGNPYPQSGASPPDGWWSNTSSTQTGGRIWAPNLPTRIVAARPSDGHLMPPGYTSGRPCRVYFPGTYPDALDLTGNIDVFFASGIYYFEQPITLSGTVKVVVGDGSKDGCTTDQEAAFYATDAPTVHGISGLGSTFVLGRSARITVTGTGAGNGPSLVFNKRYIDPLDTTTSSSAGVSIISVNGSDADGTGPSPTTDYVSASLSVPASRVEASGTTTLASNHGYLPLSSLGFVLDMSLGSTGASTVEIPGYVYVPQGMVNLTVDAAAASNKTVLLTSGLVAADIQFGSTVPGRFQVGLSNPVVMHTFKLDSVTTAGLPTMASTAIVQVKENGDYGINHWEVVSRPAAIDGPGATNPPPATTLPPPASCPATTNWRAEYYTGTGLDPSRLALCRDEVTPGGNWGSASPHSSVPADYFSARWTRVMNFQDASYDFTIGSDDGFRLFIDGVLVASVWVSRSYEQNVIRRQMPPGQHTVTIEYFELVSSARMDFTLALSPPPTTSTIATTTTSTTTTTTTTTTTIPPPTTTAPCPTSVSGWRAEYFSGTSFGQRVMCREESPANLNYSWGAGSPGSAVPVDNWSARWTRTMTFAAGTWDFWVNGDQGVRIYLDGELITPASTWSNAVSRQRIQRTLTAGSRQVVVEYYETTGNASIGVTIEPTLSTCTGSVPTTAWQAEYFSGTNFNERRICRTESLPPDYNWGNGSPDSLRVPTDSWSARWSRQMTFTAGRWRFDIGGDDAVRLYIDGVLVSDPGLWSNGGYRTQSFLLDMTAGSKLVVLEHYDWSATARVSLSLGTWSAPSCATAASWQFTAEYFAGENFNERRVCRTESDPPNYDWGGSSADPIMPVDNWSARWTAPMRAFNAGTYEFTVQADNGYRLYINNTLISNPTHWTSAPTGLIRINHTFPTSTNYNIRFEFREGTGNAIARLDWLQGTPPVTCPATPNWKAEYFTGNNLNELRECRNETTPPNVDYGMGAASIWTPVDGWSARWSTTQYFDAGSYDFAIGSDDGIRVYIDNVLVINSWWGRGYTIDRVTRTLTAGMHSIRIEYYESGGPGRISYSVGLTPPPTSTSSTTTTTTTTTLAPSVCPTITGWKAEYFNGTNFNTIRRCRNETSSYPNFDWGTASPDPLVNSDNFSARWTRTMYFGAGPWDFVIGSSDGFRLYINGTLVSNSAWWADREYTTNVITRNLTAGNHTIVIEFYEGTGSARISASVTPGE